MKIRNLISGVFFISLFIIGCDNDGDEQKNTPPEKPAPTNGISYTCEVLRPTLSWSCQDAEGDALTYTLKFGSSATSLIVKATNLSTENYTFNEELVVSSKYYWQITANDGRSETSSDIFEFSTVSNPIVNSVPSTPTIISPKTDINAGDVKFIWSVVVDDGGLENITYVLNVNGAGYEITGTTSKTVNVPVGLCNWYVTAFDKDGNGSESERVSINLGYEPQLFISKN